MSDLISRQAAINALGEAPEVWTDSPEEFAALSQWEMDVTAIKALPSADAVEVVRCGECKHMLSSGGCSIFADSDIRPSASDFCSYGERE